MSFWIVCIPAAFCTALLFAMLLGWFDGGDL